ncbi:MAG: hypothetical protein NTY38_16760 [Acidobacteria bacterium]|nr:hypothetical protein [Acidobacteriota bacterium]
MRRLLLLAALAGSAVAGLPDFALSGEANILEEAHFGIINGTATAGVPYRHVSTLNGFFAPPYASSDLLLDVRMFGERVATDSYRWFPIEVRRSGAGRGIRVESSSVLITGRRALLLAMTFQNTGPTKVRVPVDVEFRGSLDYVRFWEFARPVTNKHPTTVTANSGRVIRHNVSGSLVLGTDMPGMEWEPWSSHWVTSLTLGAGERRTHYLALAIDRCDDILRDPSAWITRSRQEYAGRVKALFDRLPRLEASDPRLVRFYNRSLMHLLTNQWRVKEFVLDPYFSTGAVLGGCLGNYLWDFGEPWEILPLYDPAASKAHIRQFLKIDLGRHFLFDPMTGQGFGPHYPVNQEKIIHLIYYYVLHTGDTAFLTETLNGRTILDHVIEHALYGDELSKPVALIDYGDGNHHLELRGKLRYDYVVPDLNGRRYRNYLTAAALAKMGGRDRSDLLERARALKALLKEKLWSPKDRWYRLLTPSGSSELRYTVQMFKLFNSAVLGEEEEAGLLSHLNEKEFLSDYGLHSMSKLDPAYDQIDIDNGGGGICTAFVPQIAERLYRAHHPRIAEDLLRRVLWWGDRAPYWGDSFVANQVDYRKDTPLQSELDSAAVAQAVIFGMFGIEVRPDGSVVIDPSPPSFSPSVKLTGLRIRGHHFDVAATPEGYEVKADGGIRRSRLGIPTVLQAR